VRCDRLHRRNVSADARSAPLHSHLQPLVGGAAKHGIAHLPMADDSRRRSAWNEGPTLRIQVENDGRPSRMIQIAETQGTGLRNLRDRLVAIVGPSTRLEVRSAPAFTGALAVVEIAFRETAAQAVAKAM
jgi:LytS/YehU family sensor histidine kinase